MTSAPARVAGFVAAVVAIFGVALGVGNAVGTTPEPAAAHAPVHEPAPTGRQAAATIPGGLMVSQNGYTFRLATDRMKAGYRTPVAFTIDGPDGRRVTEYAVEHEKRLHLIAVRRDFTGFQHVHPVLRDDGVWTTRLDLTPGQWRLFADFQATGGPSLTLGSDLAVPGGYRPAPAGGESRTARVDGYTVTLDGDLTAGADAKLTASVSRHGDPVTDLQPYLGAYGHLVALREGDLAYLHVHPDGHPGDGTTQPGPNVTFYAAVPSTGRYRLYLDFKHDGVVHAAAFTVPTGNDAVGVDQMPVGAVHSGGGHGH